MRKRKLNVAEYFEKYNSNFVKFGIQFAKIINDEELITELAQKDLEKLTKVWKLVIEMMDEKSADNGDRLAELIGEYRDVGNGDDD